MFVKLTDEEKQRLDKMTAEYQGQIDAIEKEIVVYEADKPDIQSFRIAGTTMTPDEEIRFQQMKDKLVRWWDHDAPQAWHELDLKRNGLHNTYFNERASMFMEFERRQFAELNGDPQKIEQSFYAEVDDCIKSYYQYEEKCIESAQRYTSELVVKLDNENHWKLNPNVIKSTIKRELRLHYEFFSDNPVMIERLNTYLDYEIENSDLIAKPDEILDELDTPWITRDALGRIPSLSTVKAHIYSLPNDKISNTIFKHSDAFIDNKIPIGMEKKGSGKLIDTYVTLKYLDSDRGVKEFKLEYFDYCVLGAIYSLLQAGNKAVTPLMIARCTSGNEESSEGSRGAALIQEINQSIERLFYINIEIDASKEVDTARSRYKGPRKIVRRLLPGGLDEQVIKGQKVWAYVPSPEPMPLIEYAEGKAEIISFDTRLLNVPVANSKENMNLKTYLLKRIELMKGKSAMSKNRKILYETIYAECGITSTTPAGLKKKKIQVRKKIRAMLDEWKKTELIADYAETKKGNKIDGIIITL